METYVFPNIACMRLEVYSFVCGSRTNGYCSNTRTHKRTHTNMHTRVDIRTSHMLCAVNDLPQECVDSPSLA